MYVEIIAYICGMEKFLEKFDDKYSVTDDGRVYSYKGKRKELTGKVTKSGYREVLINHKGSRLYLYVNRLVETNYIQNPEGKRTVNHKDGDKLNNHVSNLEWLSDSENLIHARDKGMLKYSKIDMETAEKIRLDSGTCRELAIKYNLSKSQINYIKNSKRWA